MKRKKKGVGGRWFCIFFSPYALIFPSDSDRLHHLDSMPEAVEAESNGFLLGRCNLLTGPMLLTWPSTAPVTSTHWMMIRQFNAKCLSSQDSICKGELKQMASSCHNLIILWLTSSRKFAYTCPGTWAFRTCRAAAGRGWGEETARGSTQACSQNKKKKGHLEVCLGKATFRWEAKKHAKMHWKQCR